MPNPEETMRHSFVGSRAAKVAAYLLCAVALACGGGGSGSDAGPTAPAAPPQTPDPVNTSTMSLMVENNHFSPVRDSVPAGSTLNWTWNSCDGDGYGGQTCTSHSVQFDDEGPSSSIQSSGSFSRTFAVVGVFTYHCAIHGQAMSGSVKVY
jgi:plastocyanin